MYISAVALVNHGVYMAQRRRNQLLQLITVAVTINRLAGAVAGTTPKAKR